MSQLKTPCILWKGRLDSDGYGRRGKRLAHRVAYEEAFGTIPSGLEVDHLCLVRACVNPDHLEAVTHAENMRRSAAAQKTHCVNGHPYDEANTRLRPQKGNRTGQRDCRRCAANRARRYRARLAREAA